MRFLALLLLPRCGCGLALIPLLDDGRGTEVSRLSSDSYPPLAPGTDVHLTTGDIGGAYAEIAVVSVRTQRGLGTPNALADLNKRLRAAARDVGGRRRDPDRLRRGGGGGRQLVLAGRDGDRRTNREPLTRRPPRRRRDRPARRCRLTLAPSAAPSVDRATGPAGAPLAGRR